MGFRYRKSINLGKGFRINISKSGIGYSYGVKGARITKTANGRTRQTISIPGTGISYVSESSSRPKSTTSTTSKAEDDYSKAVDTLNFVNLDSGIYDEAIKTVLRWKTISGLLFFAAILLGVIALFNPVLFVLAALLFITSIVLTLKQGRLNIEYNLDEQSAREYEQLCSSWKSAFNSASIWQISQTCITNSKKDNCGAKTAIKPIEISKKIFKRISPDINTNIKPFCIPIVDDNGKENGQVVLLPDRVLISKGSVLAAIENKLITTSVTVQPMAVPEGSYPNDARVVERKYLHENKDGSPDKRYSVNPLVPIVHYGRVDVETNGSTVLSLLFSNLSLIEELEHNLPIETIGHLTDKTISTEQYTNDNTSLDNHVQENADSNSAFCTNCGNQLIGNEKFCSSCGHSTETATISETNVETTLSAPASEPAHEGTALERAKAKSASADAELSEEVKKVKENISNNFGRKTYTPKQIKKFFIIAIAIAAVISLVLSIAMHSPEDDIAIGIMMFIFCTIVFSVPLVIGTLLICLPSIRKNRKNKGDNE